MEDSKFEYKKINELLLLHRKTETINNVGLMAANGEVLAKKMVYTVIMCNKQLKKFLHVIYMYYTPEVYILVIWTFFKPSTKSNINEKMQFSKPRFCKRRNHCQPLLKWSSRLKPILYLLLKIHRFFVICTLL